MATNELPTYHLFEAFGIELEYMIVHAGTLDVAPICDLLLRDVDGEFVDEVACGPLNWSNELALHVVELKTAGPVSHIDGLAEQFHHDAVRINDLLAHHAARLMPSAMHPWMDPDREMRLWPHEYSPIYEAFNRIFDCRGHGWSNLQSVHINLPFADDGEFDRLHTAIRLILPLLPALAAASPVVEQRRTGLMDTRLETYRTNARRIPEITGQVIPEPVRSHDEYVTKILEPMYQAIAPLDPENILQYEWLNARGAIARFERNTIEIRVLDIQESPRADLAVAAAVIAALRGLTAEIWTSLDEQRAVAQNLLVDQFHRSIRDADRAVITDANYLQQFGFSDQPPVTAGEVWRTLLADPRLPEPPATEHVPPLGAILTQGPLARRIENALPTSIDRAQLQSLYSELCDCLAQNRLFRAEDTR